MQHMLRERGSRRNYRLQDIQLFAVLRAIAGT